MKRPISVVICTHNPRPDHLGRTLASLYAQTLPKDDWELLLIDNASTNAVLAGVDLQRFPNARSVVESRIGLTMARIRGIEEAAADLIVFVDDDNVLAPDFLSVMLQLAQRHPTLGVIGAGRIEPEFEEEPDPALRPYTHMLALRTVDGPQWSNDPRDQVIPWGAGMAVRRTVADRYRGIILADPLKQRLDRSGNTLNSCGDDEFTWVACEMGLGKGIFPELAVVHLIGRPRVQKAYLLRLVEGHAFSRSLLKHLHGARVVPAQGEPSVGRVLGRLSRLRLSETLLEGLRWMDQRNRSAVDREFDDAKRKGIERFLTTFHA